MQRDDQSNVELNFAPKA